MSTKKTEKSYKGKIDSAHAGLKAAAEPEVVERSDW
jgi:hypothetical protein